MKQSLEAPALTRRTLLGAGLTLGAFAACPALAELRIEITGVGANQLPIAIRPFQGTSGAPADIAKIIGDDLLRSGAFRLVEVGGEKSAGKFDCTRRTGRRRAKRGFDLRDRFRDAARRQALGRALHRL